MAAVTIGNIIFDVAGPVSSFPKFPTFFASANEYFSRSFASCLQCKRPLIQPSLLLAHLTHLILSGHSPQGVLHSVLSCRMILHMYDFGRKEVTPTQATGTGLEFATRTRNSRGETTQVSELSPHDRSSSEHKTDSHSSA